MADSGRGRGKARDRKRHPSDDLDIHERARLPTDLTTMGARLRYARICRRYQLKVWAKYTDFNPHMVMYWERGERPIRHDQLRRAAYFLQVPLLWLVEGGEPPLKPLTAGQRIMAEVDISPETRLHRLRQSLPQLPHLPDLPRP